MDYQYAKNILIEEYLEQGGTNVTEFVHGMNYLQDYIESNKDKGRLQDEVPMFEQLCRLQKHLSTVNERNKFVTTKLKKEIKSLHQELHRVSAELRMFKSMSKKERKVFRNSQAVKDMRNAYSRMVSELHGVVTPKCKQMEENECLESIEKL